MLQKAQIDVCVYVSLSLSLFIFSLFGIGWNGRVGINHERRGSRFVARVRRVCECEAKPELLLLKKFLIFRIIGGVWNRWIQETRIDDVEEMDGGDWG